MFATASLSLRSLFIAIAAAAMLAASMFATAHVLTASSHHASAMNPMYSVAINTGHAADE